MRESEAPTCRGPGGILLQKIVNLENANFIINFLLELREGKVRGGLSTLQLRRPCYLCMDSIFWPANQVCFDIEPLPLLNFEVLS